MGMLSNNQVSALLGLGADAMDNMFDIVITPPKGITTFENIGAGRAGVLNAAESTFQNDITIRADGFEPPQFNVATYEVKYKAVTIERPRTKIEGKREFKITFRLDANYRAYRFLGAWKSIIMQASSSYVTNALWDDDGVGDSSVAGIGDINKVFGEVVVAALARPIYQSDGTPFSAQGVSIGKFTDGSLKTSDAAETLPLSTDLNKWRFKQVWLSALDEPKFKTDGGDAIKIVATFKFGEFVDPIFNQYSGTGE